ncbi:MAG: cation diffusion facilitator family transporter [Candidatus Omnitrophota bacterium]
MDKTIRIRNILVVILGLNLMVAVLKFVFGALIKSQSMVADGFHSLADGSSNIIGLVGIWIAGQPKDREHPYGHMKYETFTAVGIAILLFLVSFNILQDSWQGMSSHSVPSPDFNSFAVMIFTIAVNIGVVAYEYRQGRKLSSDILVSDSMHTGADLLTSFLVIFVLLAAKLGYGFLDPIAAVIIALFIAWGGVEILRHCSRVLCDTAVIEENRIEEICLKIPGVVRCHKIRTRGRGDDIHVDLHILVKNDMHIDRAHELSYRIEDDIKRQIPGVTDVVVHMEPLQSRDRAA